MLDGLKLLIQSGNPLISIVTYDEESAAATVRKAAEELGRPLLEWSLTSGMTRSLPAKGETSVKPGKAVAALDFILENQNDREIYLMRDLGQHCKDPYVLRQLRDVYQQSNISLVMIDMEPLPESIRRLAVFVETKLPDAAELEQILRKTFLAIREHSYCEISSKVSKKDVEHMAQTLRGLTAAEAARVVSMAIHDDDGLTPEDLPRLVEYKRNILRSAGCLESIHVNVTANEIGGLANLKRWLAKRRGATTAKARQYGLEQPRGILLLGVQGCGKSLCAKVVAADWQMPLLRMDPGVLYQKYIGESENRLREALCQAEVMSPVVLWIDEIEKAFASASSDSADGGLSQRMFGTLLSWMQDNRSPIFMVATANNIQALPPELMRKGRFDEVFFVDLPDAAARRQILEIHLARRKRDPQNFALERLAQAAEGFSGAELEQLVVSAMYSAFAENKELDDVFLEAEMHATRPLSSLMRERIEALRAWSKNRCVPAD